MRIEVSFRGICLFAFTPKQHVTFPGGKAPRVLMGEEVVPGQELSAHRVRDGNDHVETFCGSERGMPQPVCGKSTMARCGDLAGARFGHTLMTPRNL
ncbi:MAG: hypothetical protein P1U87_15650 [Verrucomicrobiales bacterium]|nr:hypothetical protein [Verrucomicrobiales bacterium]